MFAPKMLYNINGVAMIFLADDLLWCCVSRNFYVVVVPLKRTSGTVKNLKNPDEMDMEEVGYTWHTRNY